MLVEYFEQRQWRDSLDGAVARGQALQETTGQVFTWLTCTNAGAAEVCQAALRIAGIEEEELSMGYLCDPSSKSPLRILARHGNKVRYHENDHDGKHTKNPQSQS